MKEAARKAKIYYSDRLAGTLAETREGFLFTYDAAYLAGGPPISFTLPLRQAPYRSKHLPGFFANLLSEGWLLKLQSQKQKIDESDRFGLLLVNGSDLIGAVTVRSLSAWLRPTAKSA